MTDSLQNSKEMLPPYVNWEVTNRCNMGCPYCFLGEHPEGVIKDPGEIRSKAIIKKLADGGVKLLNYTGGEALLRDDIVELIEFGHDLGLKTILSTNGILLTNSLIDRLNGTLDWIALPLDGYSAETHDSIRGKKGHFDHIIRGLHALYYKSDINVKINTMVCKKNVNNVNKIARFLENYGIRKCKLFQFSARGKAKNIRDEYGITSQEFYHSMDDVGVCNFGLVFSSNDLRDNAYFLINPNGNVTVPVRDEYIAIGNILKDELKVFNRPNILKIDKNKFNASVSYDFRC